MTHNAEQKPRAATQETVPNVRDLWGTEYGVTALALLQALRRLNYDDHRWSRRPCDTCAAISKALGEPFGCTLFRVLGIKTTSEIIPYHSGPKDTTAAVNYAVERALAGKRLNDD